MGAELWGLLTDLFDHLLGSKVGLNLLAQGLHGVASFLESEAEALDAQGNPTPAPAPPPSSAPTDGSTVQTMAANVSAFRTIASE